MDENRPATGASPDDPLIGATLGRYEIRERRGSGGMGVVYRAYDPTLDRSVALKLLPPSHTADEEARSRFQAEARAASGLDHPNVAIVHEIGRFASEGDGPPRLYIAMGYYEGESLAERLERGPLSLHETLDLGQQIAAGLAAAHARGIVHRDIKPANLIITPEGTVKIVDFGVAKLLEETRVTDAGTLLGTMAYMSPEQATGEAVDAPSDLWSVGVVLYEALTGERPFRAANQLALIHAIADADPEPLAAARSDAPAGLVEAVSRCLEKNPHRRFQTADALEAALSAVRADISGVSAGAPGAMGRRSHRTRIAGVLAGIIAVAALAYAILQDGPAPTGAEDPATTLAILPPVAVGGDTALARLAEELVVSVSANLTGLTGLRIVDAISVLAHVDEGDAHGLERGAGLAADLGATAFVIGTLHGEGSGVRLDLQTHRTTDRALLDRSTIAVDSAGGLELSRAATRAVLEAVWEEGTPPAPNLGAISTASVPALRAYMRGEQAFVRGQFEEAIDAFEEAFAADPTFWFAYWRSVYPRSGVLERPADPDVVRQIYENRDELPTQDRLLIEASWGTTLSERLGRLEALVAAYPHYWPAWWSYANALVHYGPYLGYGAADARAAVERTLELNPRFATAWDHLEWIAEFLDDHALAERAVRRVIEIQAGIEAEAVWHRVLRFRARSLRPDPMHPDTLARFAAWITSEPVLLSVLPGAVAASGRPQLQHRLNRALLATGRSARVQAAIERGDALAWIARGAWDSALVAADRYGRLAEPEGALMAYGLAVTGAAMGAVAPDEARRRRPPERPGDEESAERVQAELAWLDGVLAWAESDRRALSRSIGRLETSAAADAGVLRRSLGALAVEADGEGARAAEDLETLEREIADGFDAGALWTRHPYVTALHRFLAARWFREDGSDARAAGLLTWYEAVDPIGGVWMQAHQVALGAITLPGRAEIAADMGSSEKARGLYARFLRFFDAPVPALAPYAERARVGLESLGTP